MVEHSSIESEVAGLIVQTLHLKVPPTQIDPVQPLFREGLGLDSIDALELSLAISKKYGFQLKSDDPDITQVFSSLRELAFAIASRRSR